MEQDRLKKETPHTADYANSKQIKLSNGHKVTIFPGSLLEKIFQQIKLPKALSLASDGTKEVTDVRKVQE